MLPRPYAAALGVLALGILLTTLVARWFFREADQFDALRFEDGVQRVSSQLKERAERYAFELEKFTDLLGRHEITAEAWRFELDHLAPKGKTPALVELIYLTNRLWKSAAEIEPLLHPITNRLGKPALHGLNSISVEPLFQWTRDCAVSPAETRAWLHLKDVNYYASGVLNAERCALPKRIVHDENGREMSAFCFAFGLFDKDVVTLPARFPEIHYRYFMDHRFLGMTLATVSWEKFVTTALAGETLQVGFESFANTNITMETWMRAGKQVSPRALDVSFRPRFKKAITWNFFRRRWTLVFFSTPEFEATSPRFRGWVALVGGMSLSFLMSGLISVQIRARRKQELITAKLETALSTVESAREDRERLNHDLHDGAIQSLYALHLGLSRSVEESRSCSSALTDRLVDHRRSVNVVIDELRGFILSHEPEKGPLGDLAGVLEKLVERLRHSTEKKVKADLSRETALKLGGEQAVHLANLAREALSNSLRHSSASEISIRLKEAEAAAVLEIVDDGIGFNAATTDGNGVGLRSMKSRARLAGGSLELDSSPGEGTRIRVIIPLRSD